MPSNIKSEIKAALNSHAGGLSLSALSRLVGYTRLSETVRNAVDELVDDGVVVFDDSGSYVIYKIAPRTTAASRRTRAAAPVMTQVAPPDEDFYEDDEDEDEDEGPLQLVRVRNVEIPEETFGYGIEENDEGDGYIVTLPEDGRQIDVSEEKRLLVINNDPNFRFLVENVEDLFTCISQAVDSYSREKGIGSWVIKDVYQGTTTAINSVSSKPVIIFLEVLRHNKAGK